MFYQFAGKQKMQFESIVNKVIQEEMVIICRYIQVV